jgi:hypothetical protein
MLSTEKLALEEIIRASSPLLDGISDEYTYQLFRHCVWRHLIELDLSLPVGPLYTPKVLKVAKYAALPEHESYTHEQRYA